METIKSKLFKARKNHICDVCNNVIEKGTIYKYHFIVDGGDHWEWRECKDCNMVIEFLLSQHYLDNGEIDNDDVEYAVYSFIIDNKLAKEDDLLLYEISKNIKLILGYIYKTEGNKDE